MEDEEDEVLESFLEWAVSLGISDSPDLHSASSSFLGHSLAVFHFPRAGGRGLAAVRDIKKGELILSVPRDALLCSSSLLGNSCKLSTYPSLSSTQILSISLLHEVGKGKNSRWYPYITQLPRSYDLLIYFSHFEIESLQMDEAIWTAEKVVQKCKIEWEEAKPLMDELYVKPQLLTYKAWKWASATILSRTMHIPWDIAGCLCPVGDFFNYTPPEESYHIGNPKLPDENENRLIDAGYNEAASRYCFYARRNYTKGEQVLLSYGTYTNLELIEHYGFLLNENPNDKAFIPLEPEMYSLCKWSKDSLYICHDGKPSFALLATARLWATHPSKRRSIGHIVYSGNQVSAENEAVVSAFIVKKCEMVICRCKTSIEEDVLLLQIIGKYQDCCHTLVAVEASSPALISEISSFLESSAAMGGTSFMKARFLDRWKLAVQWRLGYKKILFNCMTHCNKILNLSSD